MKDQLRAKIHNHTAVGAVIGLGYVGLLLRHGSGQALAVAFAERAFPSHALRLSAGSGIDVDGRKVAALQRGESDMQARPSARLAGVRGQAAGRAGAGNDPSRW